MNIKGLRPKRVHDQSPAHYFYWNWDAYKPFDYEPIIVHSNSDSKVVFSRFHWHVATIWTEPTEENGKPNVSFVRAIHTPIVDSKSSDFRYLEFEPNIPIEERISIVNLYLPLFLRCWKSVKFSDRQNYEDLLVEDKVPEKYLFRLSEVKSAVLVGRFPKPDDLPVPLRQKLWSK